MTTNNDSNDRKPSSQKKEGGVQGRLKREVMDAIDEEDKELIKQTLSFFKHKTGWIGQDENLPTAVHPSSVGSPQDHKKGGLRAEEKTEEGSLTDRLAKHGKKLFSRAIFHLKAWGTGLLMEMLMALIPASLSVTPGSTFLSSLLGMFLLFPYHMNRSATLVGFMTAILCIVAGCWPLAIAFGGIVAALVHIVNQRSVPLAFFFVLPVLLLSLALGIGTENLANLPLWLYGGAGASVLLGIVRPLWLVKWAARVFALTDKKQQEELRRQTIEAQEVAAAKEEFKDFENHVTELEKMKVRVDQLPPDMAGVVREIKVKARAILKCMKEDPRDVMPGNQFLNRYLPMLNTTIEQFLAIARHNTNSVEFERARAHTLRVLSDMDDAFGQAHQRLLDNDVDDLLVSLKVMDRLRKSDGYDREN